MRFTNNNKTPPLHLQQCMPVTVATLHDSKGHHVGTFNDVVALLQDLPSHDSGYSCDGDWFQINSTRRSYSIGLELDDIVSVVNSNSRWRIIECDVRDLVLVKDDH
jgi:hypothetical protein